MKKMIKNNKVLCVIPARAGSKGLPGKNIKKLLGKPLIAYTIKQAKGSKYIDRIIVSTDSPHIAGISRRYGVETPFIRPKKLATDKSSTVDALLHAICWLEKEEGYEFDILVLLHANAPLRKKEDIDKCIELLLSENADNVFSVTEAHRNPYFNMIKLTPDKRASLIEKGNFSSRQAAPKVFDMNSSIYVWRKAVLKETKSVFSKNTRVYIMPKERSIDIDDYLDFQIAEMLLRKKNLNGKKY